MFFQTRTLLLEPNQEVKVGRSIARNRVSENTAIFDCKVLSRNHAVIWYSDGKFYIKVTPVQGRSLLQRFSFNIFTIQFRIREVAMVHLLMNSG